MKKDGQDFDDELGAWWQMYYQLITNYLIFDDEGEEVWDQEWRIDYNALNLILRRGAWQKVVHKVLRRFRACGCVYGRGRCFSRMDFSDQVMLTKDSLLDFSSFILLVHEVINNFYGDEIKPRAI